MRRTRLLILTAIGVMLILGVSVYSNRQRIHSFLQPKVELPPAQTIDDLTPLATTSPSTSTTSTPPTKPNEPVVTQPPTLKPVALEINLAVPFASQAPFGDWSMPYGEGCEEASLIMVDHYLRGVSLSKQQMKDEIDTQVVWQVAIWGGHVDLPVNKTLELAKHFYPKYSYTIISNLTADKIREQLRLGRPVIVPAAGRELGNPNFRNPGPIYHMLVIKGFTKDGKFITNDPGTRNGADYIYTEKVLMGAIHDWTGTAADGDKVGLVMY